MKDAGVGLLAPLVILPPQGRVADKDAPLHSDALVAAFLSSESDPEILLPTDAAPPLPQKFEIRAGTMCQHHVEDAGPCGKLFTAHS